MNHDRHYNHRRSARPARFEWSAWLAAAFVLLVVAPALHAQGQQFSPQSLAPLYAALMPVASPASAATPGAVRAVETALAVFECAPQRSIARGITTPQLRDADGSAASHAYKAVETDRTAAPLPGLALAPRLQTSHVILCSALTAHQAGYRSGQRNNRSHE